MEPIYKVGDVVTIKKKREGSKDDYRFCFTDAMVEAHGGKSYKIERISFGEEGSKALVPDDGHRYLLEDVGFSWASSMFEDTTEDKSIIIDDEFIKDESTTIDAFINKKKCPVLDFTLH